MLDSFYIFRVICVRISFVESILWTIVESIESIVESYLAWQLGVRADTFN